MWSFNLFSFLTIRSAMGAILEDSTAFDTLAVGN